jgi:ribosomal protein S18 acetylase RimI-like enzyme
VDNVDKRREFAHGAIPHQIDDIDELRRQLQLATVRIREQEKKIQNLQILMGGSSGADADVDEHFTVIDHYSLRKIRATDAAALCVFCNKALGAESKAHFYPLGQQTDDTTCMRIASGQSDSNRMDLVTTSASSAYSEGRILGWAFWIMTDRGAEIGIALADAQQGRGLGKKLMQALIHKAEEKQIKELILHVNWDNDRAIAMYHNFGFEIESTFKGSTGKQEHIMSLILPQKYIYCFLTRTPEHLYVPSYFYIGVLYVLYICALILLCRFFKTKNQQ